MTLAKGSKAGISGRASCQNCDSCLCYNAEQTHRILQDVAAAEEKARVGTQPEPSSVLETEDRESLQLFNKYVHILRVFAAFEKSYVFLFRFLPPRVALISP